MHTRITCMTAASTILKALNSALIGTQLNRWPRTWGQVLSDWKYQQQRA